MGKIIDLQNLTLNAKEVSDFKQIVMKASLASPSLKALHNVMTGINMKEQIVLADKLGLSGIKGTGCQRTEAESTSIFTQKYWEPAAIEANWALCQSEVDGLFKAYYDKIDSYKQRFNIDGSDEAMFVANLVSDAAIETAYRAIWFGDTEIAEATADSEGLIDGDNAKYFDYFDGIFKQVFDGVSAGTIKRVDLSSITGETVSAAEAYKAIMDTYKAAPGALRANADAKMYVSGQIYLGLIEYLQTESVNFTLENTIEGFEAIKFLGKTVVNMEAVWDDTMKLIVADTTTNKTLYPNRIVFTTPNNIPVGTMNADDFDSVEAFYDQRDRMNYVAYGFTLDAKVLDENLIVVAY